MSEGTLDLRAYLRASRSVPVALLFVLPLLVAHETAMRLAGTGLRNAAEHSVKSLFLELGPGGAALRVLAFAVAAWAAVDVLRRRVPVLRLYVPFLLECLLMAMLLGPVVAFLTGPLRLGDVVPAMAVPAGNGAAPPLPVALLLSVGAGIYEEFVFRLLLLGGAYALAARVFRVPPAPALVASIAVSALAFAAYHHAGPFGEPFTHRAFWFRLGAGIVLGLVFALRGFAVVVYLHAIYDVLHDLRAALWVDG